MWCCVVSHMGQNLLLVIDREIPMCLFFLFVFVCLFCFVCLLVCCFFQISAEERAEATELSSLSFTLVFQFLLEPQHLWPEWRLHVEAAGPFGHGNNAEASQWLPWVLLVGAVVSSTKDALWDELSLQSYPCGHTRLVWWQPASGASGSQGEQRKGGYTPASTLGIMLQTPATFISLGLKRKAIFGVGQHALIWEI